MRAIKGKVAIAVTVAVWTVAVGAAAGLTYDLNRPLHSRTRAAPQVTSAPATPEQHPAVSEPAPEERPVMSLPPATIIGRAPGHRAAASPPKTPQQPEMMCEEWRALDMGSGRVQFCAPPPNPPTLEGPGP